jgi:hypothetical protein
MSTFRTARFGRQGVAPDKYHAVYDRFAHADKTNLLVEVSPGGPVHAAL